MKFKEYAALNEFVMPLSPSMVSNMSPEVGMIYVAVAGLGIVVPMLMGIKWWLNDHGFHFMDFIEKVYDMSIKAYKVAHSMKKVSNTRYEITVSIDEKKNVFSINKEGDGMWVISDIPVNKELFEDYFIPNFEKFVKEQKPLSYKIKDKGLFPLAKKTFQLNGYSQTKSNGFVVYSKT